VHIQLFEWAPNPQKNAKQDGELKEKNKSNEGDAQAGTSKDE
jgi:hypothetical protein